MILERPLYRPGSKPFFFFAVFGSGFERMQVSADKHGVTGIPKGLQFLPYRAAEHREYLSGFYTNQLGELLREKGDAVIRGVMQAPSCLILVGAIEEDTALDYMRNVIGIVQCALEQDGAAVLDAQTLRWHTPQEWNDTFIAQDAFNPHDHAAILVSKERDGTVWLHTRGLRKFGRPDVSIRRIPEASVPAATSLVNRLIELLADGSVLGPTARVAWRGAELTLVGSIDRNVDNSDFNNESIEYEYDPNWDKA